MKGILTYLALLLLVAALGGVASGVAHGLLADAEEATGEATAAELSEAS